SPGGHWLRRLEVRERPRGRPHHPETAQRIGRTAVPRPVAGQAPVHVESSGYPGRPDERHRPAHARQHHGARGGRCRSRAGAAGAGTAPSALGARRRREESAMTMNLTLRRRFFAEEIEAVAKLRSPRLVDAFAAVPRERFLPSGPWFVLSDAGESYMMGSAVRTQPTPDADPARVYHNIGVAIDPGRQLFNGQPATLGTWIDALGLESGKRVLHVGAGLGYYTAIMAECTGPTGRVVAYEVDDTLAHAAERNLATFGSVELRHGDGAAALDEQFDA